MPDFVLFSVNVPHALKDEVIDALMCLEITGFNLKHINGYSKEHSSYDIAEQVSGYRAFILFDVLISPEQLIGIKARLKETCGTESLKYWVTPVLDHGHI